MICFFVYICFLSRLLLKWSCSTLPARWCVLCTSIHAAKCWTCVLNVVKSCFHASSPERGKKNRQCVRLCVGSAFHLCAWVSVLGPRVGTERNSREKDRGSTLAVPEQKRPAQHRSRSVSPHREDCCRARSKPAHVPMQRSASRHI